MERQRDRQQQQEIAQCSFEPRLCNFNPKKLEIVPLIEQDPESEQKISSSLERILSQRQKNRNYSQIHSERVRQLSKEKDVVNNTVNPYYRERQEFVDRNHQNLFIRPSGSNPRQRLTFSKMSTSGNQSIDSFYKAFKVDNSTSTISKNTPKVLNSKHKNKKKSKVVVMKKKTKRTKRTTRLMPKDGVIHLGKSRKTPTNFQGSDLGLHKTEVFSLHTFNSQKSSFTNPSSQGKTYRTHGSSSVDRQAPYVPISDRLLMNQVQPHIFVGPASYTQKSGRFGTHRMQSHRVNSLQRCY